MTAFLLTVLLWGCNVDDCLNSSDAWLVSYDGSSFSFPSDVEDVGAIVSADEREIVAEDRRLGVVSKYPRAQKRAIVFLPPLDFESQKRFCEEALTNSSRFGRIWLTNGDEFSGRFVRCDRRFVYFVAFEVELKIPRGRVIAVSWKPETSAP